MTPDRDAQHADALDAAITRLLAGREAAMLPDVTALDVSFAATLIHLSASVEPETSFAAELEELLLATAVSAAPSQATGNGLSGAGRRNGRLRRGGRRLSWRQWLPLAAMVLLTILLLVPQARASMQTLIRIGAVRIGLVQETPTPQMAPAAQDTPTSTPLASPLDLAGETTLAQAQKQAGFPIRLPTYPPGLGAPQRVFLQNLDGPMVALVWVDPAQPRRVRLALFEMTNGLFVSKSNVPVVSEATVHGQRALWTE